MIPFWQISIKTTHMYVNSTEDVVKLLTVRGSIANFQQLFGHTPQYSIDIYFVSTYATISDNKSLIDLETVSHFKGSTSARNIKVFLSESNSICPIFIDL